MLGCFRRHRRRRQPRQCGWGSKWRHGLLLSKQQKPVNTADSRNTEGQCDTTKQPVSTIPHSPHRSHASTHTRPPPRKAHRRYRERHQTRLHTRATPRVSALELRGDRTRSKEMRLRVREGGGVSTFVPSTGLWMTVVWGSWRRGESGREDERNGRRVPRRAGLTRPCWRSRAMQDSHNEFRIHTEMKNKIGTFLHFVGAIFFQNARPKTRGHGNQPCVMSQGALIPLPGE